MLLGRRDSNSQLHCMDHDGSKSSTVVRELLVNDRFGVGILWNVTPLPVGNKRKSILKKDFWKSYSSFYRRRLWVNFPSSGDGCWCVFHRMPGTMGVSLGVWRGLTYRKTLGVAENWEKSGSFDNTELLALSHFYTSCGKIPFYDGWLLCYLQRYSGGMHWYGYTKKHVTDNSFMGTHHGLMHRWVVAYVQSW